MEITNKLLTELGADPKVYSEKEKELIADFADKIVAGELSSLIKDCALPEARIAEMKKEYGKNRDRLIENMKKTAILAENIAGVFANKSSIFTSSLPDLEKEELLMKAFDLMRQILTLRDETLIIVVRILNGMNDLYAVQSVYNTTLARLGIINIAAKAAETAGASYDEDEIMSPILDAYDKLTDFTAFTNDLKDKAVIYQKATEQRLGMALDSLSVHMDLMGDGKALTVKGITDDAANIKRIALDVLHTHV